MSTLALKPQLRVAMTATLDQLPDGVACYETVRHDGMIVDFRLTYCNSLFEQQVPAAYQLSLDDQMLDGRPERESLWRPIIDRYARVVETGQMTEYQLESHDRHATTCLRVAPFSEGVIVTVRDITTQQAIVAQSQWFHDVLNASLSNTLVYEAIRDETGQIQDFQIKFANENAQRDIRSRMGQETTGNSVLSLYPRSRLNGQFRHCVQVVETGQPVRTELHYPELQVWYDTSITKLGDGCIVTGLDITERKRTELRVQQQNAEQERMVYELRQSNENLRQFAQVASHDLQEPLRKIQTFCDILQSQFEDNLSDGERDMTRRIQKSAHRMQMLIKDLLAYSQLASQREPFEPVALTDVVKDVVSDLEVAIAEKNATLRITDLPIVMGSSSRLRQLFQNLIANALKFRHLDQPPVIELSAGQAQSSEIPTDLQGHSPSYWLIEVKDNGLGFDEKYKDRIFHPFQRLHDPTLYSGTGIGLAICQRVAESHGGAIDVNSQPGAGSTFKIFLPVQQDAV